MSLINQMLKDLEQRGAKSTDVQPSITPQFGVSTQKSNNRAINTIGLIFIVIAIAYAVFFALEQPNRMKDLLGFNKASVSSTENPTTKINPANFGQTIQDKGLANETLPEAPITSPNDTNEASINSQAQQNTQPSNLFETTLRYDLDQKSLAQPAKTTVVNTPKMTAPTVIEYEKKTTDPIEIKENQKSEAITTSVGKGFSPQSIASKQQTNINKKISPEQNANSYYQQALIYLQQGRVAESQANLAKALELNPTHHEARLTLASLLLDNKRLSDAKDVLNAGLQISPEQNEFRIALARLQISAGDQATALSTLEHGLQYAPNHAAYQAFLATLLQRSGRHEEAITHYMKAVSLETNAGSVKTTTLVGLGIALQAADRLEHAQQAFIKAQQTDSLSPELSSFVDQQLKKLNQSLAK
ncbi:MAG: tetratricopeptide repeat protein [Methylotenera sp.]|uniref:tetratricopeptide repeat protein n=1 Tax=Methylotenera sp. TaxID=2051956 RepID=UPI002723F1F4|nr:tetratricopeptide repeat protein [Methylotenera sp.]MDO9150380.1 tetratricopeptide repeat protein [Methylotenera sp.]